MSEVNKAMKIIKKPLIYLIVLCVLSTAFAFYTFAAPAMSVTGPSEVRSGDTIKLTFKLNGAKSNGAEFTVNFDSSKITYSSHAASVSGWKVETAADGKNGVMKFLAWDDTGKAAISGNKNLFTMTFKVRSGLDTGTAVSVKATGIAITDGETETSQGSAEYSVKLVAPLSSDCTLSSLALDKTEISPAFSASKTEYTANVDHTVSSLKVTAKANDSKAKVTVSGGDSLKTGKNTISVTVKAENGSSKVYKITVTKSEDPNRVENSDSTLRSLVPSVGILSPVFSADVTEYIIYLPYEIDKIKLDGTHNDSRASSIDAEGELIPGENKFVVRCTAENGTVTEYMVTVMRMPKLGEELPPEVGTTPADTDDITASVETEPYETEDITISDTETTIGEYTDTVSETSESPDTQQPSDNITMNTNVKLWTVALIALGALLLGAGCGFLAFRK